MTTFLFQGANGEQTEWSPSDSDMRRWVSRFPGLDVQQQVESLAGWTHKNWRNKSKRRKVRTAMEWVTRMLKKSHEKAEGYSGISRARDELAKPEWERRGMTREQWDEEQNRIFHEKQQGRMDLLPPPSPEETSMIAAMKADLESRMPERMEFRKPPSRLEQQHCRHDWTPDNWAFGRFCRTCEINEHEARTAWLI